jgi:beta-mannanase
MYTQEPVTEWNLPKYYYPGDDYIDWIGFSIYGALHSGEDYWDTYDDILTDNGAYKRMLEISSNKPFTILEMGVTDQHSLGDKSAWLNNAFQKILEGKYIKFQAVNYWHENWDNDSSLTSLRVDSSQKTLKPSKKL